ncbi:MAG: dTDP-4-dehydrorhamnose reductase [Candidatus Schekmanbacteria bacterium]|nr:dTDP-4-dehydrorhamnose reductase [Candidatus Schekmanbacteria bacterium]
MSCALLVGAGGMLSRDVAARLSKDFDVKGFSIHELDIRDRENVSVMFGKLRPAVVVNCAAYTNVDGCETNRDEAMSVNSAGVLNLALEAKKHGSLMVHFSTDYIFDGTKKSPYKEDDMPNPINFYGKSKFEGERWLIESGCEYIIVRTEWLYGAVGKNFVFTMLEKQKNQGTISVVDDQRGSPTWTDELAVAVTKLLQKKCRGIYNVTASGDCTWYNFALKIFDAAKLKAEVLPIKTSQSNRTASRPTYSVLDCSKFEKDTGMRMKNWDDALLSFLREVKITC